MNTKRKKKILLLASTSILASSTAAVMAFSFSSDLAKMRGTSEIAGTLTWNASNEKTVHSANRASYKASSESGTQFVLYSYGKHDIPTGAIFDSEGSDYLKYGLFICSSEGDSSSLFQFQYITSVTVVTSGSSTSGAGFGIYTSSNSEETPVASGAVSSSEDESFTFTSQVVGAHYLAVRPTTTTLELIVKSITITYSCEPGEEPIESEYNISYYGMDSEYNMIPLVGIDTSSIPSKAQEGSLVEFTPVASEGYQYNGGFGVQDTAVEDVVSDSSGKISFTMPSEDVAFVLVTVETTVSLSSISVSGQTSEFTVGDTFSFGGTVTAHYSDSSSANVTSAATFSGYDMSQAGEQSVTVSYTESGVTKTTIYSITVKSSSTPVTISGTYNFSSRAGSGSNYPSWPSMKITFNSDGTATWENHRSHSLGQVDCECYFTYTAINNGANISINMSLTGYYFVRGGSVWDSASAWTGYGYDRPVDAGFTVSTAKNNSGVMSLDRSSMTINVFDKDHSYEVYDTFTFTLAA